MGEPAQLADWRVRATAGAGALVLCAAFCALLALASRTTLTPERAAQGVAVWIERPPERALARPSQPRAAGAPPADLSQAPPADASVAMLSRLLRCARRPGQPRPPDCPREAEPQDWRRPQIPSGGDYAQPDQPDMDRIYTRAERETLVTPSCVRDKSSSVCIPFGVRPPPPSRSAEQICREGGLGGPCTPPPEAAN